jgi:excisionase family DNA binding protein
VGVPSETWERLRNLDVDEIGRSVPAVPGFPYKGKVTAATNPRSCANARVPGCTYFVYVLRSASSYRGTKEIEMPATDVPEHVVSPDPAEHETLGILLDLLTQIAERPARTAKLVGPDGSEVEIPDSAFVALRAVVRDMANGLTVTLIPHDKELTTKEAADILNVSRPFLVRLLDRDEIPYHRVGSHRRLNVEDVLAYREVRAARRRQKLRELTELSEQLEGGYR